MAYRAGLVAAIVACLAFGRSATAEIPRPERLLGHAIGEDYYLADYGQLRAYWTAVAASTDRVKVVDIGATEGGRRQVMAVVSSPENLADLDRYRDIAARLARAEGLTEPQARALAAEGKAIVWIDGGLHATETAPSQALFQGVYDLASRDDPETVRLRRDVIVLFAQANPDGQDMVSQWYMRQADPKAREYRYLPELYHKYVGHDVNRDFYMSSMRETANINKVLFRTWFPQIVYDQHQTGPEGTVVFMPPFRDPFNYNYDPLIISELGEVGAAMHSRLIAEGKPGSTMRTGANFSTWFNGSARTVSYFHNAIGLLTEIIGNPTPIQVPLIASRQIARTDLPAPVPPQTWRMARTIDYTLSMNRAVFDYASRNRERLLFNIYRMGANAIARGQTDSWTVTPRRIAALEKAAPKGLTGAAVPSGLYQEVLHDPAVRDPRAYVISADQPDFPTAVLFVDALVKTGVRVERLTAKAEIAGRAYPAGSFVVRTGQAYRAHVLDMFEPQDHPNDLAYPGGPPVKPYDAAGYTLALQMGVRFDRVFEDVHAELVALDDEVGPPSAQVSGRGRAGFVVDHQVNNGFILTNRLLKAGERVAWLGSPVTVGGKVFPAGALWIPATARSRRLVEGAAHDLGVAAVAVGEVPQATLHQLRAPRIGLVDVYGGLMTTGWTRWFLEHFEFPYEVVYPQRLKSPGGLRGFDVLVFANHALRYPDQKDFESERPQPGKADIPPEFWSRLGDLDPKTVTPAVARFLHAGGSVVAIGSSTRLAQDLNLPVENVTRARQPDGGDRPLSDRDFYIPGSLLEVTTDNAQPLAFGLPARLSVYFDQSPAFRRLDARTGARPGAWFEGDDLLRSGWALGQAKLAGAEVALDIPVGRGRLILLGPEVAQRAQSHGAFKFLLNGLLLGGSESSPRTPAGPKARPIGAGR